MQNEKQTALKKRAMLEALEKTLGVVTQAAKIAKITRKTHYQWIHEDPEYKENVDDLENMVLDFAESKLHKSMNEDNVTATIFFLKTRGKKRGYVEGLQVEATNVNLNSELSEKQKAEAIERVKKGLAEFDDYE